MKITKWLMGGSLIVFLAAVSLGSLVARDREFSENENRYLASFPELSWGNILNCDFQNGLENYINDQIVGRDLWITIKTGIQKLVGDTDIGGAYVGKDGYDFEKITQDDVNDKLVKKNIDEIAEFFAGAKEKLGEEQVKFLLIPTSGLILADKLPTNAPLFDQEAVLAAAREGIGEKSFLEIRSILSQHAEEEVYYRTDHHWTSYGAFLAYQEYCRSLGIAIEEDAYVTETVTKDFRGSLYSKILDYDSAYDSIVRYTNSSLQTSFRVTIDGKEAEGMYFNDRLQEKDKYLYFLGGNYAEVVISKEDVAEKSVVASGETSNEMAEGSTDGTSVTGEKNLLLVKDSFGNCFAPLVAEQFDHVYMIDLRYFRGDVSAYMEENQITDVLVLYNVSNFISDKNIHKLN